MRCILKKTLRKIVRCGHDYVAQVKGNQPDLSRWVEFNTSVSRPISEHMTYGRHEERIYDDLYQIKKEWPSVRRIIKVSFEEDISRICTICLYHVEQSCHKHDEHQQGKKALWMEPLALRSQEWP